MSSFNIAQRLAQPSPTVDLASLSALWRHADVEVLAAAPSGFAIDDSLPGRIRGALGQALMRSANAGDEHAATLFELIFAEAPPWRRQFPDLPRPFAALASGNAGALRVRLRLYGFALALAPALASALREALAGGIAIAERARTRIALPVETTTIRQHEGVIRRVEIARWICAVFKTPVAVMQGERSRVTAENLTAAIVRRVLHMAAWQDVSLKASELQHAISELEWALFPQSRARHQWNSGRQGRGGLTMEGVRVTLVGQGRSQNAEWLLRLGEQAHVGARTAFGYGAYRCFAV